MEAVRSVRAVMDVFVNDAMWQISATQIGQNSLGCLDRILKIVQDLNFFSAPLKEQQTALEDCEEFKNSKISLGWFISLPLLFFFRVARTFISLMAWPFGMSFSAMTAAYYINAQRRKLRHYKTHGARTKDTIKQNLRTHWIVQKVIALFIYGPLNFFQFFVGKLFRNPSPCQLSHSSNRKAKRSSKETKTPPNADDMTTSELLDLHAAEEDNLSDDPDFEVKSQDLNAVSEEEDDDDDLDEDESNSGPEEDKQPIEKEIIGKDGASTQEQENNQNPEDQQNHHHHHENHENNHGGEQPQDNHNHEHGHHDQHHHHHHHHH